MAEWILLLSQKLLNVYNVCTHTCAMTSTPLVNCVVNDALVYCCSLVNAAITFYYFNYLNAYHKYETIELVNSKFVHGVIFQ